MLSEYPVAPDLPESCTCGLQQESNYEISVAQTEVHDGDYWVSLVRITLLTSKIGPVEIWTVSNSERWFSYSEVSQ